MTEDKSSRIKGKVVGDYIIEFPVITEIDYEKALEYIEANFGQYGCTAVAKKISNGDTIAGRSYDLMWNTSPACILRTAIPGRYKTIGLAYNGVNGEPYEKIRDEGMKEIDYLTVYAITGDVLNEKGFYIEANMRDNQPEDTGIKECSGTNPGAKVRLSYACVARYLGERAANVDEALELIKTCDVYGIKRDGMNWGGGFYMADASGHYGVLELVDNKLVWNDMQKVQANFYLSPEYRDRATLGSGFGRYDTVMNGWDAVDSENDMSRLMKKVRYLQILDPDTCEFNPVSEITGAEVDGKKYFIKDVLDPNNKEILIAGLRESFKPLRNLSIDDIRNNGHVWFSAYQLVTNCNKLTMRVRFFETNRLSYLITFDGTF